MSEVLNMGIKELMLGAVFVLVYYATASFLSGRAAPAEAIRAQLRRQVRLRSTRTTLQSESAIPAAPKTEGMRRLLVSSIDKKLVGRRLTQDIATKLRRADIKLQASEFLLCSLASAAGCLGLASVLRVGQKLSLLAFFLGLWFPFQFVEWKLARRTRAFDCQLSDCLSLLANSLRSGYSLQQAIDVVAREMPAPLSKEFGQIMKESRLNVPLEDSLRSMVQRVPSTDLDLVVTAVLIQRQVGGNLGEVLDAINSTIRDRIKVKGEIRTLTAEGRISGWIVGALPFAIAVFIFLFNPSYLYPMFRHPLGIAITGAGFLLQLVGILLIRKIVDVEV